MPTRAQAETAARKRLAEHGVRATDARVAVLAELVRERDDATAQDIHARLRRRGRVIGLATVYRALALLVESHVIDALSHEPGQTCYRICGEGHHHHLVCSECHRVVEVGECGLEPWLDALAARHGFASLHHRLEVVGRCVACA